MGFIGRGFSTRVGPPFGRDLAKQNEASSGGDINYAMLGEKCPTGALRTKE